MAEIRKSNQSASSSVAAAVMAAMGQGVRPATPGVGPNGEELEDSTKKASGGSSPASASSMLGAVATTSYDPFLRTIPGRTAPASASSASNPDPETDASKDQSPGATDADQ